MLKKTETGKLGKAEGRGGVGGGGVGLSHVPFRWGMRGLGRVVPPRTSNLALFYLGQKLLIALSCWYHIRRLFTAKFTTHTRLPV